MTPEQVVSTAIDLLERPDFEELGRQNLRNAINQCHSLSEFARDLGQVQVTKEEVLTPQGVIAVPLTRLGKPVRRMVKILPFDNRNNPITWLDFKQLPYSSTTLTDYFGIEHRQLYQIVGSCLNIWGLGKEISSIILTFVTFPELKENEEGELESDSWILHSMPDMVVTSLALLLAKLTQDRDLIQQLQGEFSMHARMLLQSYGTEILSANTIPRS